MRREVQSENVSQIVPHSSLSAQHSLDDQNGALSIRYQMLPAFIEESATLIKNAQNLQFVSFDAIDHRKRSLANRVFKGIFEVIRRMPDVRVLGDKLNHALKLRSGVSFSRRKHSAAVVLKPRDVVSRVQDV